MQFSGKESVIIENLLKEPAQPMFQIVVDIVAMTLVLIIQTGIAVAYEDFSDNYLCLLYVAKLLLDSGCYFFMTNTSESFSKKLFTVRSIFDVLQLGAGYCLYRFENTHLECYIALCGVIGVELCFSTILAFGLTPKNRQQKFMKDDLEHFVYVKPQEEVETSVEGNQSDMVSVSGLKQKPANISSMISGSTAASIFSR